MQKVLIPTLFLIILLIGILGTPVSADTDTGQVYCVEGRLGYINSDLYYSGVIYDPDADITVIRIFFSPSLDYGNLTIEKFTVVYAKEPPACRPSGGFNIRQVIAKYDYTFEDWDYVDKNNTIYEYDVQVPIPQLEPSTEYYFAVLMYAHNSTHNIYIGIWTNYTVTAPSSSSGGLFGWLGSAIGNALSSIGQAIVNAFMAILPQQLKDLLNGVWQFFSTVATLFYNAVVYIVNFAVFFKLLAILIPVIAITITIYDPLLVPQFFMWLFEQMKKVVQFIRSLLPI